eukprot:jgi/Mesvir1/9577/Mv16477-RA.1
MDATHRDDTMVVTIDESGTILSASIKCLNFFGYSSEELVGNNVDVLMPEPFKSLHQHYIARYLKTGAARIIGTSRRVDGIHRNGAILPFRLAVSRVDVDGAILFVGLIERCKETAARIVMDANGKIMSVNKMFVDIFGYLPEDVLGKPLATIVAPKYGSQPDAFFQRYVKAAVTPVSPSTSRNLEGMKKSGHAMPISLVVSTEEQANGGSVFIATVEDLETLELRGLCTCDSTGTIQSANSALLHLFGYRDITPLVGKNIEMLIPTLSVETLQARDSTTFGMMRLTATHADGSSFHVLVETTEYPSSTEGRIYSVSIRHAEQKLKHKFQTNDMPIPVDLDTLGQYVGHYRVGKLLGVGSFAVVFLATHRVTGRFVALKVTENKGNSTVEREIEVLRRLRHKNIAKMYEVIRTPRLTFIVMEYVSGGDLFDHVANSRSAGLPEEEARKLFRGMLSAVDHCHANYVLHRDLKLENVLLDEQGEVKLVDFGLSTFLQPAARMNTFCGTPAYASPEVLTGSASLGPECDIWSLGVMLYTLMTAAMPFQTDPALVIAGNYRLPAHISPDCSDLIRRMLRNKPGERISMVGIMNHPWVNDNGRLPTLAASERMGPSIGPSRTLTGLTISPEVLESMVPYGFDPDIVVASLRNNSFNQVTATYKLMEESLPGRQNSNGSKPPVPSGLSKEGGAAVALGAPGSVAGAVGAGGGGAATPGAIDTGSSHTHVGGSGLGPNWHHTMSKDNSQQVRKSYRCKKCDYLDKAAMLGDARMLAEVQQLVRESNALIAYLAERAGMPLPEPMSPDRSVSLPAPSSVMSQTKLHFAIQGLRHRLQQQESFFRAKEKERRT